VRGLAVVVAALALAPAAVAAPPAVSAAATPAQGVAPLRVVLTASGDAASYVWALGDGATATGASVTHVYGPGRHVAVVTATNELGETAQAEVVVQVAERSVTLEAPRAADHRGAVVLTGVVRPAPATGRVTLHRAGAWVTSVPVRAGGRYRANVRLLGPGPYEARYGAARSEARTILVRPRLVTSVPATVALGGKAAARARLVPAAAGTVRIRVLAGDRLLAQKRGSGTVSVPLPAGAARPLRVVVETEPQPGFAAARATASSDVVLPSLGRGSSGPSVLALERRLSELRYALRGVDSVYGHDTFEAVMAFQKVHGLPRTGRVDATFWRLLAKATVPQPRYGRDDHIEVDKTRNVLYEIVGGRVHRIVHVSTGATGNTPVGSFRVYRKVVGWDWVLWYPMYFLRGFAIHGYPSVPAYPASHGCVRVPMWIAPSLFARHGHGTRIVVFT